MAKVDSDQSLVVLDDDAEILRQISKAMKHRFTVLCTSESDRAMAWVRNDKSVKLLMVGQDVRGGTGILVLESAMQIRPEVRRILMTSYTDLATLMHGLHSGTIHRTVGKSSLHEELASLGAHAPAHRAAAAAPARQ